MSISKWLAGLRVEAKLLHRRGVAEVKLDRFLGLQLKLLTGVLPTMKDDMILRAADCVQKD